MILRHHLLASGKLRAFLIHLGASAIVVGSVGLLMVAVWFPGPWFMHDGGWMVYRIIVMVDVVVGPLLTLIVFRRGKPELQRDIAIIVALQLGALAFGASTMYQHRPAFVVFLENSFFTVARSEVLRATRDPDRIECLRPARGPGFVIFRAPTDRRQLEHLAALRKETGLDRVAYGDFYDALSAQDWQSVFGRGPTIESLARQDPAIAAELERFRQRNAIPTELLGFIPVVTRNKVILLIVDRDTKAIVDWLE